MIKVMQNSRLSLVLRKKKGKEIYYDSDQLQYSIANNKNKRTPLSYSSPFQFSCQNKTRVF